jgi:hypothetical protein
MLTLYGAILKCPRHHRKTEVYRGVKIHYLKEDTTRGYYLNTFTSTSTNDEIADGFSNRNNGDGVISFYYYRRSRMYSYRRCRRGAIDQPISTISIY